MKPPAKVKEIQNYTLNPTPGYKSISFSQLSVWTSCPLKWYRSYIKKEAPYDPSIHTVFGTAFHETLQTWLDILYNQSVKEAEAFNMESFLEQRLKEIYVKERAAKGTDFTSAKELASFYEDGVSILKYIKSNRKLFFSTKNVFLVGCEIPILYQLKPGFYFKGFIDCLLYDADLNKWKILDFKTSTSGWNAETKKDFNKVSQVLLYKQFMSRQFDVPIEDIDVEYFIVKRKIMENAQYPAMKKRVQEFVPSAGTKNVKKAVALVESFISDTLTDIGGYQDKEYVATPSEHSCKWCIFKDDCRFK